MSDDKATFLTDPSRLAALASFAILDTPAEDEFDDIVVVAAELCEVPTALVSLVDADRQWFKAKIGFGEPQTPIEQSVCAHGLGSKELLVIPDLTADARTRDNPLVTMAGGIRFYAGAPLVAASGPVVGMLCVIDVEPRPAGLTDRQARGLKVLAHQVMLLMSLRRSLRARDDVIERQKESGDALSARAETSEAAQAVLQDSDDRARAAQAAGRIGTFELDIATDMMTVSPEFCELFGVTPRPTYPASAFTSLVLPDDAGQASTPESRRAGTAIADIEIRIRRADDGRLSWISRRSTFIDGADGTPKKMFGTVHDVTERRLASERVAALLRLGDRLRDVADPRQAAAAAASELSSVLAATRVGYAEVDRAAGIFTVIADQVEPGVDSIIGDHPLDQFPATMHRLASDHTIAVANVLHTAWLEIDQPAYSDLGVCAMIKVPLNVRGELIGILFVHDAKARTWLTVEVEFAHSIADRTYAALAKLRAEADQRVLNGELSHRLKNTLSMVQAIANQTLRVVPDRAPVDAFDRRLLALSSAHDILLDSNWVSASLGDVVRSTTTKLREDDAMRIEGPDIALSPQTALTTALVMHELSTNAMKYGALSVPDGTVHVSWRVEQIDRVATLVLDWIERGGPPAQEPTRHGFGSRLISRGLTGTGGSALSYSQEGFAAEFKVSLARAQRS